MKKELFKLREECARCLLCFDPVCTKACKNGLDPARAVRSVRFENEKQAVEYLDEVFVKNVKAIVKKPVYIMMLLCA